MATYDSIEIQVNITNGGCNIATGSYPLNEDLHIELTPNKLYGNTSTSKTPYLKWIYTSSNGVAFSQKFTQSDDEVDVWTLDTPMAYYQAPYTDMYCTITYEYNRKYTELKSNLTHVTCDTENGAYPFETRTITVTADAGYEFKNTPTISYYKLDTTVTPQKYVYYDFDFTMVSETKYTYTVTFDSYNKLYTINAEASQSTDITDKYGVITVYKPDKNILTALSKVRFATPKIQDVTVDGATLVLVSDEYIDTAKYAVSLRKFYIQVETSIEENIQLGPYDTGITCPVIGTDLITLDMGTIAIAGRHKNIMDYKNTEMQVYLPFVGIEDISPSDFMDKDINLKYEINVIDGDATAILYAAGEPMKMFSCNVSFPVPYKLNDREDLNTTLTPNTNYLQDVKPFIYVKSYNAAVPDAELPYNDTKYYAKFADCTGYTQATEIDLTVIHDYITKTEIDEIVQLLESGVFL